MARAVPSVELAVAALVVWPQTRAIGAAAPVALFASYAFYLAWLRYARPDVPCGCFGHESSATPLHIFLVLGLLGISALVYLADNGARAVSDFALSAILVLPALLAVEAALAMAEVVRSMTTAHPR